MLAIGLMSGTSRDGVDAALIRTDGEGQVEPIDFRTVAYDDGFRDRLRRACERAMAMAEPSPDPLIDAVAGELTDRHITLIEGWQADVIGFHGHTVAHRPDRGWTWQIGDGARLAKATGIDVVDQLRRADVAAGGQGAPMLPVYHRALAAGLAKPIAIVNLGGVANITYIGRDEALIAFDTGMANGLIDNWVQAEAGVAYDAGGVAAAAGRIDRTVLTAMLDNPWFERPPPKSIDREDFTIQPAKGLSVADGAATLTAFSAASIELAIRLLPARPIRLVVAGGGRRNPTLMRLISQQCGLEVVPIDRLGWDGDAIEAQGFAYMAVRSLAGLPISFPGTTGVPIPKCGGQLHVSP